MSSDEADTLLQPEKDQSDIRKELSQMSFQDLQKLKEKVGTKMYNAVMFGKKDVKRLQFKRENKNRPREESAKKPVGRFREIIPLKKKELRDPRFDSLYGEYNEKIFKKNYSFLNDMKKNELEVLKKELKTEQDPKTIKKIKYLIQRLQNQISAQKMKEQKETKDHEEKQEIASAIKEGEKPKFIKKSEKRMMNLVLQYEELKNSGKLKKHIERIRKKKLKNDRKRLEESTSD